MCCAKQVSRSLSARASGVTKRSVTVCWSFKKGRRKSDSLAEETRNWARSEKTRERSSTDVKALQLAVRGGVGANRTLSSWSSVAPCSSSGTST